MTEQVVFSKITPNSAMISEAKISPNGWIYVIASDYNSTENIPLKQ